MRKRLKQHIPKWPSLAIAIFLYASVIQADCIARELESPKSYIAGDTDYGEGSTWINVYINAANQKPVANYQGYNAVSKGLTVGVNNLDCAGDIIGFGAGYAHTDTSAHAGGNLNYATNGWYALGFGTHNWQCHNFLDWHVYGNYSRNYAESSIFNNAANGEISSEYYSFSFAGRVTRGKSFYFWDSYNFTPLTYAQYVYLNQPSFTQINNNLALRLTNPSKNFVTFGLGAKLNFPTDAWRCVGMREVRIGVSYDVLNSNSVTNDNLIMFDSTKLLIIGSSSRLAFQVGAGFTYCFADRFDVLFNYDFELRSGFTSNTGLIKLRYTF